MYFSEDAFYHVYNRSFNHTKLFYSDENYKFFQQKFISIKPYCKIMAYCFMPDHFHLLIYIPETRQTALSGQTGKTTSEILSRKIGTVLSSFTQAINKQELRVGSLFQPKTKAKEVDAMDHLEAVFHYIHQNPIRAGLTKEIQDWRYSSFFEFFNESFNLVDKDIVNQFLELDLRPNNLLKQSKSMIPDYIINPFVN